MNRQLLIRALLVVLIIAGFAIPLVGQILEVKRGNFSKECRTYASSLIPGSAHLITLYPDLDSTLDAHTKITARTLFNIPLYNSRVPASGICQ